MDTTTLLEKLVELDRALQHSNDAAARALVMQAEDCVLAVERQMIQVQAEKVRRAAYSPVLAAGVPVKVQAFPKPERTAWSGQRTWRSMPQICSQMLVAAVRTSLQRLPYPI